MIALFNTDEMRFEWEKMSKIPNGLEIKPRLLFTEMALTPAMRRGQKRRLYSVAAPLSPLLPENVAELKVIFITNEINNAAICIQLGPEGLQRLRGMRIFGETTQQQTER